MSHDLHCKLWKSLWESRDSHYEEKNPQNAHIISKFEYFSICHYNKTAKIKWIITKYETWFNFFLALFMSGYKWDKQDLEKSSFKANQVLHQLILDVVGKVTLGGHLYPLINKAKKKSNQVSYLVSIHLIFPFSYALFMSWINET